MVNAKWMVHLAYLHSVFRANVVGFQAKSAGVWKCCIQQCKIWLDILTSIRTLKSEQNAVCWAVERVCNFVCSSSTFVLVRPSPNNQHFLMCNVCFDLMFWPWPSPCVGVIVWDVNTVEKRFHNYKFERILIHYFKDHSEVCVYVL